MHVCDSLALNTLLAYILSVRNVFRINDRIRQISIYLRIGPYIDGSKINISLLFLARNDIVIIIILGLKRFFGG